MVLFSIGKTPKTEKTLKRPLAMKNSNRKTMPSILVYTLIKTYYGKSKLKTPLKTFKREAYTSKTDA